MRHILFKYNLSLPLFSFALPSNDYIVNNSSSSVTSGIQSPHLCSHSALFLWRESKKHTDFFLTNVALPPPSLSLSDTHFALVAALANNFFFWTYSFFLLLPPSTWIFISSVLTHQFAYLRLQLLHFPQKQFKVWEANIICNGPFIYPLLYIKTMLFPLRVSVFSSVDTHFSGV